MTPDMYELFAYPIVKGMFDRCCPGANDGRYQHSDSAMGHLLPILSRLNYSGVNFGPTVLASEIRQHMPRTVIEGQLAPFTLSRDEQETIVLEFLRDHEMTRETRGLRFSTAGSINNGSRLTGMRLVMSAIQNFGQLTPKRGGGADVARADLLLLPGRITSIGGRRKRSNRCQ